MHHSDAEGSHGSNKHMHGHTVNEMDLTQADGNELVSC